MPPAGVNLLEPSHRLDHLLHDNGVLDLRNGLEAVKFFLVVELTDSSDCTDLAVLSELSVLTAPGVSTSASADSALAPLALSARMR